DPANAVERKNRWHAAPPAGCLRQGHAPPGQLRKRLSRAPPSPPDFDPPPTPPRLNTPAPPDTRFEQRPPLLLNTPAPQPGHFNRARFVYPLPPLPICRRLFLPRYSTVSHNNA